MVNWFEGPGCVARDPDLHVTLVSAPLELCHTVPTHPGSRANPFGGYKARARARACPGGAGLCG